MGGQVDCDLCVCFFFPLSLFVYFIIIQQGGFNEKKNIKWTEMSTGRDQNSPVWV